MKGLIGKLVILVLILIGVSGCFGDPCDDKYDVGDFIDDLLFEDDNYTDGLDDLMCFLEDLEDTFGGGGGEGPEPTYYYNFEVSFTITDDSGESILDVKPSSYNLLLSTENCGSFMYSKNPLVYSDYIREGRYWLCERPPPPYSFNECMTRTPSDTLYFEFDDRLAASCGDSADVTLTIIVDQPGYAPVSAAYDFTLHYYNPGGAASLHNSRTSGEIDIYLQLEPE